MSVIFYSISLILRYSQSFLSKLVTLGVLFSADVRAVLGAKLVILGILSWSLFILALRVVLVVKWVISAILSSIFFILALYAPFSTTLSFTTSLNLLKLTRACTNYQHLIYLIYFSNCLN